MQRHWAVNDWEWQAFYFIIIIIIALLSRSPFSPDNQALYTIIRALKDDGTDGNALGINSWTSLLAVSCTSSLYW